MSTVAFDTLEFTEALKKAGVSDEQAKAQVKVMTNALGQALDGQVATREDIIKLDNKLDKKIDLSISEVKAEQRLLKWMQGVTLGFVVAMFWKMFIA